MPKTDSRSCVIDPNCWFDKESDEQYTFDVVCASIRRDGGNRQIFHQCGRFDLSFEKLFPEVYKQLIAGNSE